VEVDEGIGVEKGATGKVRIAILGAGRVGLVPEIESTLRREAPGVAR